MDRKTIRISLAFPTGTLILALFLMLFTTLPVAYATPPTSVSGNFTVTLVPTGPPRFADGNTIIPLSVTVTNTGDLTGTCAGEQTAIIHPDGELNFHGTCTYTGTVLGSAPGTASVSFEGTGVAGGAFLVHLILGQGAAGLAGLHGNITFDGTTTGPGTGAGTYSGTAHFDSS